ncbi:DivIVA domain-containing protein [Brachybacterium paraconglomeratum]|uniref:DivIVA domain-containing protein n=1 Tax=Brachybacterium sp. TaxID=1891286 RepID=UPI003242FE95
MDVRFTVTRFAEGYDMREVDEFLDRCDRALRARDGSVRAQDVLQMRFSSVRFGQGYAMDEVDQFLDEVLAPRIEAAARDEEGRPLEDAPADRAAPSGSATGGTGPSGSGAVPGPAAEEPARGGHPAEQRQGLLSRLLGRDR